MTRAPPLADLGRTIAGGDPPKAVARASRLGMAAAAPFGASSAEGAFGGRRSASGAAGGEPGTPARQGIPRPGPGGRAAPGTAPGALARRAPAAAAPAAAPGEFDPVVAHRPFCPCVAFPVDEGRGETRPGGAARIGWAYCLESLVGGDLDASPAGGGGADGAGPGGGARKRVFEADEDGHQLFRKIMRKAGM